MKLAAVHESLVGTFRTWRNVRLESAMRVKADIVGSCKAASVAR